MNTNMVGTVFKIQVAAVRNYKSYKYTSLKDYGAMQFEDIDAGIRRVMLVPNALSQDGLQGFDSKEDALNTLNQIIFNTRFETAFVIQITNGERVGDGFRSLEEFESSDAEDDTDDYEGF